MCLALIPQCCAVMCPDCVSCRVIERALATDQPLKLGPLSSWLQPQRKVLPLGALVIDLPVEWGWTHLKQICGHQVCEEWASMGHGSWIPPPVWSRSSSSWWAAHSIAAVQT